MSHYKDPYKPTDRFTPREINGWNLKITFLKGKSSSGCIKMRVQQTGACMRSTHILSLPRKIARATIEFHERFLQGPDLSCRLSDDSGKVERANFELIPISGKMLARTMCVYLYNARPTRRSGSIVLSYCPFVHSRKHFA